jgi:Flp pilus assembly protein CpaB
VRHRLLAPARRSSIPRTRRRPARRRTRGFALARVRRRPVVYWTVVGVLALATGGALASVADEAGGRVIDTGEVRRVPVARATIEAGTALDDANIEWRSLPHAALPHDVASEVEGRRARSTIYAGEPVLEPRLAEAGLGPVAARLPADTRALAIPLTLGAPPVEVGDRVDLLAVVDPMLVDGVPPGPVARRAVVVHHTEELVTVAVERDEVDEVALALAAGNVVLAHAAG